MSDQLGKSIPGGIKADDFARRRLLADLTTQPNFVKLREILSGARQGKKLLGNTIWGEIRWSALLGRPSAPTLSAGFRVLHHVIETHARVEGGVQVPFDITAPKPSPLMWDGVEHGGELAVLFMATGANRAPNAIGFRVDNPNVIMVDFDPGVPFRGRSPLAPLGIETIVPSKSTAILDEGEVALLEFRIKAERP